MNAADGNCHGSQPTNLGRAVWFFLEASPNWHAGLASILYTDRTTSGGPNNSYFGGTFDFVTSYMFIFSNDMTFATNVGTLTVDVTAPAQPMTVSSFQTLSLISNIPAAQYVKWQVLGTNGNNPGAADFAFFGQ
jgi:hypothetical protein